ncbi:Rpn family recombination-promoting nuclease/putative transposase [Pseudoduganella sp. LjRoot289]|uniref:Rpn family recombination-promoting nuclease/putative transposase n=1 Tax=Pseudoduganella sp. LjRoot289 TaxID=3342314 RepID=UPI003ED0E231
MKDASRPERWMALRMQVYAGLLYQELLKQRSWARKTLLPPLLPVVIYSGAAAWRAAGAMSALRGPTAAGLRRFQPEQRYLLVDLARQAALCSGEPGNVLVALFQCTRSGLARQLMPALAYIDGWLLTQCSEALLRAVTRWVVGHLRQRFKGITISTNSTLEEVRTMHVREFATFTDQLKFEVEQESLKKGRKLGRQEGLQEGLQAARRILIRLLERDSGPLSATTIERVRAAEPDQLQEWLDQVIDGKRPVALLEP